MNIHMQYMSAVFKKRLKIVRTVVTTLRHFINRFIIFIIIIIIIIVCRIRGRIKHGCG